MPCYQVIRMSCEFKAAHWDLLERSLKSLGWQYVKQGDRVTIDGGDIVLDLRAQKATFDQTLQDRVNQLKQKYSMTAVQEIARRNRWQVQMTAPGRGVFQRMF